MLFWKSEELVHWLDTAAMDLMEQIPIILFLPLQGNDLPAYVRCTTQNQDIQS